MIILVDLFIDLNDNMSNKKIFSLETGDNGDY